MGTRVHGDFSFTRDMRKETRSPASKSAKPRPPVPLPVVQDAKEALLLADFAKLTAGDHSGREHPTAEPAHEGTVAAEKRL